jgi:acyl-CoA synthetase (AMP-forming)/AMP-acid ligase II
MYPIAHLIGHTVVMMRSFDPAGMLLLIEKYHCTRFTAAPTVVSMLLRHDSFDQFNLRSLRRIGYGAAPMPREVLTQAMDRLPGVRFIGGFGMTELGGPATYLDPEQHLVALKEGDATILGSVGRAMPLVQARVVGPTCETSPWGGRRTGLPRRSGFLGILEPAGGHRRDDRRWLASHRRRREARRGRKHLRH